MKTPYDTIMDILDEEFEFTLGELCRASATPAETIIEMVEEGLLEPRGPNPQQWRFTGPALYRVQTALRLQRDLHVNLAGAALVLDLLDEIARLRERLARLDQG